MVFENLFGLQRDKNRLRNGINLVKSPLVLAKNLFFVVLTTVHSSFAFFTEVLPAFAARGLNALADLTYSYGEEGIGNIVLDGYTPFKLGKFALAYVGYHALLVLSGVIEMASLLFTGIHLLGRAMTSPIVSVKLAWFEGASEKGLKKYGSAGYVIGFLLATLSIVTTITAYTLLLPLLAAVVPAIGIHLAPLVAQILSAIGSNVVMPAFLGFAQLGIVFSPILTGLTVVTGAALGIFGPMFKWVADWCRKKWRESGGDIELKNVIDQETQKTENILLESDYIHFDKEKNPSPSLISSYNDTDVPTGTMYYHNSTPRSQEEENSNKLHNEPKRWISYTSSSDDDSV